MTVDIGSWQAIAGAVGILIVGVHSKWEARRTRKKAEKAVELSAPTGNGFAAAVTESLSRIEAAQIRTDKKIDDHIAVHADADVIKMRRRRT